MGMIIPFHRKDNNKHTIRLKGLWTPTVRYKEVSSKFKNILDMTL
jgi:hypothetical protein